jgi:hypothetical protein
MRESSSKANDAYQAHPMRKLGLRKNNILAYALSNAENDNLKIKEEHQQLS